MAAGSRGVPRAVWATPLPAVPGNRGTGEKLAAYRRLASLREYVLISQRSRRVEVYRRDGRRWVLDDLGPGERWARSCPEPHASLSPMGADAPTTPPAEDDVDVSLIRWMLSLSAEERLEVLQGFADSVAAVTDEAHAT